VTGGARRRPPWVHLRHLWRRFVGSWSRAEPPAEDLAWVRDQLLPGEWVAFQQLMACDQRHSIDVARRFVAIRSVTSRDEVAGALLHDIGKMASNLGVVARVVATVVGPVTPRFARYRNHEQLGVTILRAAGSSPITIDLTIGKGAAAADLAEADDI
jgi:putative nucleotidyltransferase with HDIG domain